MGPPGQMPQVIFCALLCIFTKDSHVSVKNSSFEGTYHVDIIGYIEWEWFPELTGPILIPRGLGET